VPTHNENLAELSITRIAGLVGMAKETVSKRLREEGLEPSRTDGRTVYYTTRDALHVLLSGADPQVQKARYDRVRADIAEKQLAKLNGALAPIEDLAWALAEISTAVKQRVLGVGPRVADAVAAESDAATCDAIITAACKDALQALGDLTVEGLASGRDPSGDHAAT
jgi:hypothetical protein